MGVDLMLPGGMGLVALCARRCAVGVVRDSWLSGLVLARGLCARFSLFTLLIVSGLIVGERW